MSERLITFNSDYGLQYLEKGVTENYEQTTLEKVSGTFCGIELTNLSENEYDNKKIDFIFKLNNESEMLYRLRIGKFAYFTWGLLNKLLTVLNELKIGENLAIICRRNNSGYYDWFVNYKGKSLRQKFSFKDPKLGFREGDQTFNQVRKKMHISAWSAKFAEVWAYVPPKKTKTKEGYYTPKPEDLTKDYDEYYEYFDKPF